ncbi:MAG TPA: hypothetical protein VJT83_04200 [Chitinophagaceae bacterium]|nr:hypothetical protein [Chitinophagaceae bacterium]
MNKSFRYFPFVLVLIMIACNGPSKKGSDGQTGNYFPVNDFILSEIKLLDSLPVGIMKKQTIGDQKDSGYIQLPEFRALSRAFINPELEQGKFEENYKETSFGDEATGFFTFTYEPKNDQVNVTRLDVLVKQGAASDKLHSIYMEKRYLSNDTSVTEKLYWKSNTSFSIYKEKRAGSDSAAKNEKIEVIWDPASY